MAIGDDAAAAGMPVLNPAVAKVADGATEINLTRDIIAQRTSAILAIAKGGTGATSAAAARTNLSLYSKSEVDSKLDTKAPMTHNHSASQITSGTLSVDRIPNVPWSKITGEPSTYAPSAHTHISLDSGSARFGWNAAGSEFLSNRQVGITNNLVVGAVVSNVYARNNPVSTNYVSLYVNSDGRYGATPSAARFKQDITPHAYSREQLRAIQLVTYRLKDAVAADPDAPYEVGVIAEQLIEVGLSDFVLFDDEGNTLSVAYERLALVAIGAMQEMLDDLESLANRVSALEAA